MPTRTTSLIGHENQMINSICFYFSNIFEGNVSAANLTQFESFYVSLIFGEYIAPLVILPGLIGNTLSLMVASQRHNRKLPFGLCVGALAIADNAMLLFGQFVTWIFYYFLPNAMTHRLCQWQLAARMFCSNCGAWIIVILTFERYISVSKALSNPAPRSRRNTIIALISLVIISLGKNMHYFETAEFLYHRTWPVYFCGIALQRSDSAIIAVTVFELLFNSIIPFIFILTVNVIIIWKIRKLAKFKRRLNEARTVTSLAYTTDDSKEEFKRNYETGSGMTAMLVSISIAFVLLTAPIFINRFIFAFVEAPLPIDITAEYLLLDSIFSVFFTTNYAINFYIYCVAAPSFRKDLKTLWKRFMGIFPRKYTLSKIFIIFDPSQSSDTQLRSFSVSKRTVPEATCTASTNVTDRTSSLNQDENSW